MKRYKVKEVIDLLKQDGWVQIHCVGSHRQFKHPTKSGKVTINGKPSDTMEQNNLFSIWKQAGWR